MSGDIGRNVGRAIAAWQQYMGKPVQVSTTGGRICLHTETHKLDLWLKPAYSYAQYAGGTVTSPARKGVELQFQLYDKKTGIVNAPTTSLPIYGGIANITWDNQQKARELMKGTVTRWIGT